MDTHCLACDGEAFDWVVVAVVVAADMETIVDTWEGVVAVAAAALGIQVASSHRRHQHTYLDVLHRSWVVVHQE